MSTLAYNGVILPYPTTTDYRREAVADESGTDLYQIHWTIAVQCVISADYLPLLAPDLVSGGVPLTANPADIMNLIEKRLFQPRRALSYKVNGVEMIPQPLPGNPGTVDVNNGPKPKVCSLTAITSSLFLLNYVIEAWYWENNVIDTTTGPVTSLTKPRAASPILLNRWTETQEIDAFNYTTKTREGRFIIRSDNSDGQIADLYRNEMAMLSVPPGFLRTHSRYTVNPDGLAIDYSITDREQFKPPPRTGAVNTSVYQARGHYTDSLTGAGGPKRFIDLSLDLIGGKDTSQLELCRTILAIAADKMRKITGFAPITGSDYGMIVQSASITVHMWENRISYEARYLIPQDQTLPRFKKQLPFGKINTFVFGSDANPVAQNPSPMFPQHGSSQAVVPALLRAAGYFDPNLIGLRVDPSTGKFQPNRPEPGTAGKTKET